MDYRTKQHRLYDIFPGFGDKEELLFVDFLQGQAGTLGD